jgi:LmbE family N-acetylglucosaminyl deacetylase
MMTRRFAGVGSTPQAWRGWPGADGLPVTAPEILVPKPYRAVFIAPHPDDESIALSGTIARLLMLKRPMLLIAATDGSARRAAMNRSSSHPSPPGSHLTIWHTLQRLGTGRTTILRSGLDEGEIASVERDLEWRLRGSLLPSDIVFATWRYDGHPDHEAVGRIAARACAALVVHLVEIPVRAWQWSFPGDRRIPWKRARRIFLDRAPKPRSGSRRGKRPEQAKSVPSRGRSAAPEELLMRAAGPYEVVFV